MSTKQPYTGDAAFGPNDTADSTSSTGAKVGDAVNQAKQAAGNLTDQAQQKTGQVVDQVKQQATSQASTQKHVAAQSLSGVAQAVSGFSQQLRQNNQEPLAHYTDQASGQLQRMSSYLQNRNVGEIIDDVEDIARREPALFLAGAFAVGILAARFLKSSGSRANQASNDRSANSGRSYGSYNTSGSPYATSGYNYPQPRTGTQMGGRSQFGAAKNTPDGIYDPGTTGQDAREVHF
ncbi:MAG: hypothetical protein ABI068_05500 [Ktedonobacterales bacterium]